MLHVKAVRKCAPKVKYNRVTKIVCFFFEKGNK